MMRVSAVMLVVVSVGGCATSGRFPTASEGETTLPPAAQGLPDPRVCAQVPDPGQGARSERQRQALLHLGLGTGYLREGAHEVALEELRKSLDLDPKLAEAHGAMALLLNALGRTAEADASHRKALSLAPHSPDLHNNYGTFLCAAGQYKAADAHFRCALQNPLYSTPEVAYANAGDCAQRAGERGQARQDLETAVMIAPQFLPPRLMLAELLLELGDAEEALRHYRRYADRAPPSAASLALGVRIARAAGDDDAAASYALRLRDRFPDSPESAALDRL